MALTQVTGPYPIFTDLDGSPLDDGYLYIGAANQDPETNPIQVFWDSTLTIPATQPIRTNNGYAWRNGTPGLLYTGGEFSITIRNKRNEFVLYSPLGYGFDPKAVSASVVKNDFIGDGVETDFTLSASPSTKLATNVFINGVYQEKDSYGLSGNVINFSIAPPLSSSIEILTNETGVINSGNANDISYTLNESGAVGQTVQTKLEQYVSVKDFGAVGDGVTDDTAAIQAAVNSLSSAGGTLYFPSGTYQVSTAITLCSNIVIVGAGIEATKITVVGTGVNNIFYALNERNIKISDVWFYGNSQANASGNGLAIYLYQDGTAAQDGGNIRIENCRFDNFKGDYWIYVVNDNTTYAISGVYVTNNYFNSLPGNARNGTTPAVPSACVSIQGSTAGAMATDIVVSNNAANCEHIKSFLLLWQGCDRAVVEGNVISNAGLGAGIQNDAGAYALMVYDSSGLNVPRKVVIDGNIISGVRSCGIYAAAAKELLISNNKISDQTDTVDVTLPKGGIVLNSCTDVQMVGNQLNSIAAVGIYWQPGTSINANIFAGENTLSSCIRGIKFVSFLFDSRNLNIIGNTIVDCTYGIEIQTIGNTVEISGVSIVDNHILSTVASSYGINLRSDDGFYRVTNAKISGNYVKTVNHGIYWRGAGPTVISDNMLVGPFATRALDLQNATNLNITANSFFDQTSGGECLFTAGAEGSMRENSFENCSTSLLIVVSGGTDMGRVVPTWTPTGRGPFVQNVAAIETGTTGSKYIVSGWYYDGTAWLQSRALTGN